MKEISNKVVAIVFLFIIFFILIWTVLDRGEEIKENIIAICNQEEKTKYEKTVEITQKSESIINENIAFKKTFIDYYGLIQKVLQKHYIEDSNDNTRDIIKTKDNMLTFIQKEQNMEEKALKIVDFNSFLAENDIPFYYIQAPYKVRKEEDLPIGVKDYANDNANRLLKTLNEEKVNCIDLRKYLENMDIKEEYFVTDHHWHIKTAFKMANEITKILNEQNEFKIKSFYSDIKNYNVITQENNYLGSIGKRIGKYYAGVEDFTYILPNFETNLSVHKLEETREGTFEETVIEKELINSKDITDNRYACYFGGDFPEIIVKNNKEEVTNKKILVIQDSYGLPFSSFLSLRVKELRILDLRHFEGNEKEYINQYNPDIVLMIYNPSAFYIDKIFEFK